MDNVKCLCASHNGRDLIDRTFNLSFDTVYKCFFTDSEFMRRFRQDKKFRNAELTEWNENKRRLYFELDLGTFGVSKNTEEQVYIKLIVYL